MKDNIIQRYIVVIYRTDVKCESTDGVGLDFDF